MSFRIILTDSYTGCTIAIDSPAKLSAESAADALTQVLRRDASDAEPATCRAFIEHSLTGQANVASASAIVLEYGPALFSGLAHASFDPAWRPTGADDWVVL